MNRTSRKCILMFSRAKHHIPGFFHMSKPASHRKKNLEATPKTSAQPFSVITILNFYYYNFLYFLYHEKTKVKS